MQTRPCAIVVCINLPRANTKTMTAPVNHSTSISLGRLVLLVRDYDAAVQFYQDAFGAVVLFDATSPDGQRYVHVGFDADRQRDDVPAAGFWFLQANGADSSRVGNQSGGHPLAVLYTKDCATAMERFVDAGGTVRRPMTEADGAEFAHVADLYGNEFVLVQMGA